LRDLGGWGAARGNDDRLFAHTGSHARHGCAGIPGRSCNNGFEVGFNRAGHYQGAGAILEGCAWISAFVFDPEFLHAEAFPQRFGLVDWGETHLVEGGSRETGIGGGKQWRIAPDGEFATLENAPLIDLSWILFKTEVGIQIAATGQTVVCDLVGLKTLPTIRTLKVAKRHYGSN